MKNKIFSLKYLFEYPNAKNIEITLNLDSSNLKFINDRTTAPDWAKLSNQQCPNCTLDAKEFKYCPIAFNIVDIIEIFKEASSTEEVEVHITSGERDYGKVTTLQHGLSSLVGVVMASSGCPVMDKLRPLVKYHLPFANLDETRFRVISMYLLAQFLRKEHGMIPDWNLNGIIRLYDNIQILNIKFCERLSAIKINDASLNAVVILNCFANYIPFSLGIETLENLIPLFSAYMTDKEI